MEVELQPAVSFFAVTPSDTVNLSSPARALYIGVSGDVVAINPKGVAVTFTAAPVGILPIYTTRVNSTGTSATNIVALL